MTVVRMLLRVAAVLIAVAGAIDPVLTRARSVTPIVRVVAVGDDAFRTAHDVRDALAAADIDAHVRVHREPARAAACSRSGSCILVSSGQVPRRVTSGAAVLAAVRIPPESGRVIASVETPGRVPLNAASVARVVLNQPVERVEVFDDDVLVGSLDGNDSKVAAVPWVPIADGPRALRVKVASDSVDVGVVVTHERVRVLFFEPETTWAGTFVRRALADDTRFLLEGRTQVAPPVAITRGSAAQLTAAALEHSEVVVIAAPDSLRAADVDLLERFVRHRGGSLVVVLDRRPGGPFVRLLPKIAEERRELRPQQIGLLRANELLDFAAGVGVTTLTRAADRDVLVSRALGRGRVIVSGALNAWKYRDSGGAYETFWRSMVWDAAVAAGPPLRVNAERLLVRPNEEVRLAIEMQTLSDKGNEVSAEGRYDCGADAGTLRLWPEPRPGTFAARFYPREAGECRVRVAVGERSAAISIFVKDEVRTRDEDNGRLAAVVAAHGGVIVEPGRADELTSHIRSRSPRQVERSETRPMRSPWWIVPFVTCLGGEWLLRRRAGMR